MSDELLQSIISESKDAKSAPEASTEAPATEPTSETPAAEAAAEVVTPEPVKADPPKETPPSALRALMQKEKEIRDREAKLKDHEPELAEYRELLRLKRENPDALLEKLGFRQPAQEEQEPTAILSSRLEQLEARLAQQAKAEEERERQAAYNEARTGVHTWLESSKEKFPYAAAVGAGDTIYDHIQDHYRRTGEILSEEKAASEVETRLGEFTEKLLSANKAKTKVAGKSQTNTLTKTMAAKTGAEDTSGMSDDELLKYVISTQAR